MPDPAPTDTATEQAPTCDNDPNARPAWACLLCPPPRKVGAWRRADPGYLTCSGCYDRTRERLREVRDRYDRLDPSPGGSGEFGRRPPGFGSRSPASDHVIAMRDARSSAVAKVWTGRDGRVHRETEAPPLSVRNVLDTLAFDIAEQRGIEPPKPELDVAGLTRWLDHQLDWITRQPVAVDVDTALRALLRQLRPATGDPAPRHVGECPSVPDDDDGHPIPCGTRLYAPVKGDTIRCNGCGRVWPRSEWLRLGTVLDGGAS